MIKKIENEFQKRFLDNANYDLYGIVYLLNFIDLSSIEKSLKVNIKT